MIGPDQQSNAGLVCLVSSRPFLPGFVLMYKLSAELCFPIRYHLTLPPILPAHLAKLMRCRDQKPYGCFAEGITFHTSQDKIQSGVLSQNIWVSLSHPAVLGLGMPDQKSWHSLCGSCFHRCMHPSTIA